MLSALCLLAVAAPYNYTGKLIDLMPEGATWGMPRTGLSVQITITENGAKVAPASFNLKAPKWESDAPLKLEGLKYANGVLTGAVSFKNASGCALDAVRFDIVAASEQYKGADGKAVSRDLPVTEESPILFGDMPKDAQSESFDVKASGLAWKPETTQITVTGKLSGLTFHKVLFEEHVGPFLDLDSKGRLFFGSREKAAIYRGDPEKDTCESVSSTPEAVVQVAVNPLDGTICATWLNSHNFTFYSPGGDEKGMIEEGETDGMNGWPQMGRYDGKGNLYLGFGSYVSQFSGGKPTFVLKQAGQYEFTGYVMFDVAKDGTLFIGSESNVFRFEPGGKGARKILQGPDAKLGRIHGIQAIRVDPNNCVWVADAADGEFYGRVCVFDSNGKFIWTFGRGGDSHLDEGFRDGQVSGSVNSMAIGTDGRVFVANYEQSRSVMYFTEF